MPNKKKTEKTEAQLLEEELLNPRKNGFFKVDDDKIAKAAGRSAGTFSAFWLSSLSPARSLRW